MGSEKIHKGVRKTIRADRISRPYFSRRRPDLNRRIRLLQSLALPLGHVAIGVHYTDRENAYQALNEQAIDLYAEFQEAVGYNDGHNIESRKYRLDYLNGF